MKRTASIVALALTMAAVPALAQNGTQTKPKVTVPSGQNSGAGIAGYSGDKNGPASGTVGSAANKANKQENPGVRDQDAAKIKGLPGNKSGPAAKPPSH